MPGTHHHSLQHKQVTSLANEADSPEATSPYSRTPALRNSHKIAERKRRTEMKSLFDTLKAQIPASHGSKSSKWEILSKGTSLPGVFNYSQLISVKPRITSETSKVIARLAVRHKFNYSIVDKSSKHYDESAKVFAMNNTIFIRRCSTTAIKQGQVRLRQCIHKPLCTLLLHQWEILQDRFHRFRMAFLP